LKNRKIELMKI